MDNTRVVVGFDGSAHAAPALAWAASEAARRRAPLVVVTAAEVVGGDFAPSVDVEKATQEWVDATAREGVDRAVELTPEVQAVPEGHLGHPVDVLAEASQDAALVVVGSRGHGSFTGALLGSVAFALTAKAACPVVVVRGDPSTPPGSHAPVVVGTDGSPSGDAAVALAADFAAAWHAPLTVAVAWSLDPADSWVVAYGMAVSPGRAPATHVSHAAQEVAEAAAEQARARHPELTVSTLVESGPPAQVLVHAGHGARLVVVGARGRGLVSGMLLGSVSHATIHGSSCPVAVVRGGR